ncbi:MAG: glutamate decarboxylase [Deltaproteobacteria bacterium]|nr:glutamate decarboxylase [Deltaproteobacteria bacterium]
MVTRQKNLDDIPEHEQNLIPIYGRDAMEKPVPKYELPEHSLDPDVAYNLIHDELMLDGNARLNLATFVTTWMEPQAQRLMAETFDKNMIDKDEYPFTAAIEERCINIVTRLFHAPETGVGASAIGSSEAVMLAGMALKWRWRDRMKKKGKPTDKPNLVMGNNVQVVWEKFARYWEVEPRYIEMEPNQYFITPKGVLDVVDENTIGVVPILGVTYTGAFEPVEAIHDALVEHNAKTGHDIPMHVDAASGGFVAPFLQPELKWDFRLPLVKSINVSGHKYGLVYPGVGWVAWRSHEDLPKDLVFHVNYLGGDMPTFTLNFSRPGNQVIAQYYNFIRLGREGYTRVFEQMRDTATYLSSAIEKMERFDLLSRGDTIPVFAFALKDSSKYTVYDLSDKLREHGWQVPAYTMPPKVDDLAVLRICVREGFSRDLADMLLKHLGDAIRHFEAQPSYAPKQPDKTGKVHRNC